MFCPNCGNEIRDDSKFCDNCGTKLEEESFPQIGVSAGSDLSAEAPVAAAGAIQVLIPPKKRSGRRMIAMICACIVVLLGAGGIIVKSCYARDFLQLVYGNDKYTKTVGKAANQYFGKGMITVMDDFSAAAAEQKKDHAVEQKTSFHVSLDDKVGQMVGSSVDSKDTVNQITDYINSLSFQSNTNYHGGLTQIGMGISDRSGNLLSAKGFIDKNNDGYYQLPDISKTYFRSDQETAFTTPGTIAGKFNYDEKQFSASLNRLTEICNRAIDESDTSVEKNEELSVQDVTVNAEKVTMTLSGRQLADLSENLIDAMSSDDSMYAFVSQNYNRILESSPGILKIGMSAMGMNSFDSTQMDKLKLDRDNYREFWSSLKSSAKNIPDKVKELSFSSYMNPKNEMVGGTCEILLKDDAAGPEKICLNYVTKEGGQSPEKALNVTSDGDEYFYVTQESDSKQGGELTLMAKDPKSDQRAGVKVEYSDCKKDKFMGMPVFLGTYTISLEDPQNVMEDGTLGGVYDPTEKELLQDITHSTISVTNSLDGKKMNTSLAVNLKGLGALKINQNTAEAASEPIAVPDVPDSDSIHFTENGIGVGEDELTSAYGKSLLEYLSKLVRSHSDLSDILSLMNISQDEIDYALQNY